MARVFVDPVAAATIHVCKGTLLHTTQANCVTLDDSTRKTSSCFGQLHVAFENSLQAWSEQRLVAAAGRH